MTTTALEKSKRELPEAVVERGITTAQWNTLRSSLFPGAKIESVILVWDYCQARHLDPMKKPCHIVPMEVKVGDKYEWRDVVMPGIYELRTTAARTGLYLGHSTPEYGPSVKQNGVEAPKWCSMTFYRWNTIANDKIAFPVKTFFAEVVATKRDGTANQRWSKAPTQMLTKTCEAAGLREAFPDEIGGEHTAEEMDGQRAIAATDDTKAIEALAKPAAFDEWITDLTAAADLGDATLATAYKESKPELRTYLSATEPEAWEALKARAAAVPIATEDQ